MKLLLPLVSSITQADCRHVRWNEQSRPPGRRAGAAVIKIINYARVSGREAAVKFTPRPFRKFPAASTTLTAITGASRFNQTNCIPYYAFLFIRKASRTSNRRGQKIISRTKVIIGLTIVDSPSLAVVFPFSLDVDVHGKISLIIIDTGSSYHSELREQIARETVLLMTARRAIKFTYSLDYENRGTHR